MKNYHELKQMVRELTEENSCLTPNEIANHLGEDISRINSILTALSKTKKPIKHISKKEAKSFKFKVSDTTSRVYAIGDIVKFGFTPIRITYIDADLDVVKGNCLNRTYDKEIGRLSEVKPIELDENIKLIYCDGEDYKVGVEFDGETYAPRYLHELQHIMRIFGKEI